MHPTLLIAGAGLALTACAMTPPAPKAIDNAVLPEAVRVPAGEPQKLHVSTRDGAITYECREKKDAAGQHEWVFAGPVAGLQDARGQSVGKYWGPPATWASSDGSQVTGKQLAVAPHQPGSIPLQLVKADPATGAGAMQGVTYIQRLNTVGGVAPAVPCAAANLGERRVVAYSADYVFYGR